MNAMQRLHFAPLALAAVLACTAPTVGAQATSQPGVFVPAPEGTVLVYQRKSEGSYGQYEGPVRWTIGQRDWNGRKLVSSTSERHGIQLLDPGNHAIVAQLSSDGQPLMSFNPPMAYEWPLAVGKAWRGVYELTRYTPPMLSSLTIDYKVETLEEVSVPAGRFMAYKVVTTNSLGETDQTWTVPSLGIGTLKVVRDRPANHPLGPGHLEGVLVSRSLPPQ